jgi:hypothetical protein
MERVVEYVLAFALLAAAGFGLPRWFEWRRSLVNRLQQQPEDVGHV